MFFNLKPGVKTILFVGGSQGARSVNQSLAKQIDEILNENVQIIWQCGTGFYETARILLDGMKEDRTCRVKVFDFISRMDLVYAASDIVVSRAGAIAISELCIAGKPLILIPLPSAAEDHQTKNAMALVEKDAAILIKDNQLDELLAKTITSLVKDNDRQVAMSENIKTLARPEATEKIVDEVIKLLER
jgi:UDP-N-acetylglucosamine--N-acetylmuramyl-(pentapeptide) pyrophosphoryl-undecaprenol N-acetylglucosamine transferase